MLRNFGWLSVLILWIAGSAHATAPAARWADLATPVFYHLTAENGLPAAGATALAEDRQGFLWIGSEAGLARWDGMRFRRYAADRESGLPDDLVKVLHIDRQGRLWVGTNAGGIARYDAARDRFVAVGPGAGLRHPGVRVIGDDQGGGLWVGTVGGLDHVDGASLRVRHVPLLARGGGLVEGEVAALVADDQGRLLIGTRQGLFMLQAGQSRFQKVNLPVASRQLQPAILALVADTRGRIWIGTEGAGAFLLPRQGPAIAIAGTDPGPNASTAGDITEIAQAGTGAMWLATGNRGIIIVDPNTLSLRRMRHSAAIPTSLADDRPKALFCDRRGTMWVGSQRALSRFNAAQTGVWTIWGGTDGHRGLADQDVTAMLTVDRDHIWIGMPRNGVQILDRRRGTVRRVGNGQAAALLGSARIFTIVDGGDFIFIGTDTGLFRASRDGAILTRLSPPGAHGRQQIAAIVRRGNILWLGQSDGIWRMDLQHGTVKPVAASAKLSDRRIEILAPAPENTFWVSTQNGLNHYDPRTGRVKRIPLGRGRNDGLVSTLLTDQAGRLWAGVYGLGIAVIDVRAGTDRVRVIGVRDGLPDANVDKLLEDCDGRIWASTDDGLAVVDPRHGGVRKILHAQGLAISAYWNGSGARTEQCELLFGGVGGVTVVEPSRFAQGSVRPRLVLTDLEIDGVPTSLPGLAGPGSRLVLQPGRRGFSIGFALLDYADGAGARYAYRLIGFTDGWIDTDRRGTSFTNLPPGSYELQVRGVASDGLAGDNLIRLPIRVEPRWYQTLWIKIAAGLILIIVLAAVVHLGTLTLRARQQRLEAMVAQRTAELRASQRELEQLAYVDPLTGLPNRRLFNQDFTKLVARCARQKVNAALLLLDLDHFKSINDSLGHDAGDALLTEVSARLRKAIRIPDCIARLGGDEFAILLADVEGPSAVAALCERLLAEIAQPILFRGLEIGTSGTIGAAMFGYPEAATDEVYKQADVALYQAKELARGTWTLVDGRLGSLS